MTPQSKSRSAEPDVKREHETLYRQVRADEPIIIQDRIQRDHYLQRVNQLLDQIRSISDQPASRQMLSWVRRATNQWQTVFEDVFQIPRDIPREVGVDGPSVSMALSLPPLQFNEIEARMRHWAYHAGESRKVAALQRAVAEAKESPERVHEILPSTPEDMEHDWYQAKVHFAVEVLEGGVRFPDQMVPEAYAILESVWLDDVKRLKAFLIWEAVGAEYTPDRDADHYAAACDELRATAMNPVAKAPIHAFVEVRRYLEGRYLDHGQIAPQSRPCVHELIAAKARRVWELTGQCRPAAMNWDMALRYVQTYYENVVGAVLDNDLKRVTAVLQTISGDDTGFLRQGILNCFEAAIILSFFAPEAVAQTGIEICRVL